MLSYVLNPPFKAFGLALTVGRIILNCFKFEIGLRIYPRVDFGWGFVSISLNNTFSTVQNTFYQIFIQSKNTHTTWKNLPVCFNFKTGKCRDVPA
jgi:hypothetical protein